jgi:hypothetical protein
MELCLSGSPMWILSKICNDVLSDDREFEIP